MMDLTNFTIDELNELAEAIKVQKKAVREAEKENRTAERQKIADEMRGKVSEGDSVVFLYGRDNKSYTGTVIRVSEKSVTVEAEVFAENSKNGETTRYVRFDRIVSVDENTNTDAEDIAV